MFYFGISYDHSYELEDNMDYNACKDIRSFYKVEGYNTGYDDTDFFYYEIEKKDIFEIGSEISYKQKDFYVREYEAYKNKEDIFYKYKLCRKNGVWQSIIYNERLKGATLEGKVLETQNEQVKLHSGKKFIDWMGLDSSGVDEMAENDPKQLMDKQLEFLQVELIPNTERNTWYPTTNYHSPSAI